MTFDPKRLHETLQSLRTQLSETEDLDDSTAEELSTTIADIESALERDDPHAARHPSLVDRLSDAGRSYEETHPTLSATLARLIDTLAQMGI
ncbi:MAG: DUF4404 family protein [Pirellulales bacterium]